jgi:membrane protein YqaA with SNARE-associated domain
MGLIIPVLVVDGTEIAVYSGVMSLPYFSSLSVILVTKISRTAIVAAMLLSFFFLCRNPLGVVGWFSHYSLTSVMLG